MSGDQFDLREFLPYLLNIAAEEASRSFQHIYRERYGLLRAEWRVLFHVGHYGEMTARDVAERARMHKTKISRAVARLEERGMLRRRADRSDRRQEILSLTDTGRSAFEDLSVEAARHDARLRDALGDREVARLKSTLAKIAKLDS